MTQGLVSLDQLLQRSVLHLLEHHVGLEFSERFFWLIAGLIDLVQLHVRVRVLRVEGLRGAQLGYRLIEVLVVTGDHRQAAANIKTIAPSSDQR